MRCERESVGVVLPACLPFDHQRGDTYEAVRTGRPSRIHAGRDARGEQITQLGRIPTTSEALRAFAQRLGPDDQVALEATGNTYAVVQVLQQHAGRVVVSNPVQTRAIADARIKTDKIDAEVLVRLLAGGWLPEVWMPDAETQALRQQVAHRVRLVRHHTRLKNRIHGVLHRNLIPGCPRSVAICSAKRAGNGSRRRRCRNSPCMSKRSCSSRYANSSR